MVKRKGGAIIVKMLSSAGTGFFYTARKNPKTATGKWAFRKYDPIVREHVIFKETKLESGRKR